MYSVVLLMALSGGADTPALGHGCKGCSSYGCGGGARHGGCEGGYGAPAMPPAGTVLPVEPTPKKTSLEPAPATIVVNLPAEAKLTVDGNPTTSTSDRRVFVSPALDRGMEYFYTLKAEVVRGGKTETRTEKVTVRAGEETKVDINFAT